MLACGVKLLCQVTASVKSEATEVRLVFDLKLQDTIREKGRKERLQVVNRPNAEDL